MMVEKMILVVLSLVDILIMLSGEIGCTTSHLKAMKHFLENTDSPYAIMMEDDCDSYNILGTLPGQISLHTSRMIMMWCNLQLFVLEIFM